MVKNKIWHKYTTLTEEQVYCSGNKKRKKTVTISNICSSRRKE